MNIIDQVKTAREIATECGVPLSIIQSFCEKEAFAEGARKAESFWLIDAFYVTTEIKKEIRQVVAAEKKRIIHKIRDRIESEKYQITLMKKDFDEGEYAVQLFGSWAECLAKAGYRPKVRNPGNTRKIVPTNQHK